MKTEETALGTTAIKPFLKWAGGKTQLLAEIEKLYPFHKGCTKYAEPFVGGGAVLFDVLSKYELESVFISDTNSELINAYCVIRDNVDRLISKLSTFQKEFLALDKVGRKNYYLEKRAHFNKLKLHESTARTAVERAALFIFLNKTCFNGLFRVNKKGLFNVPMGSYKNPQICNESNLSAISDQLQKVTIICGDYRISASYIDSNTFVYFDPPYRPLEAHTNFTSYTAQNFSDREQLELARYVCLLNKAGAYVALSNSDPKNVNPTDNFFDEAYADLCIKRIDAARMINSKGNARGKIKELLITNC